MLNDRERNVDISICLCTFNRADQLQNALDSLITQRTKGEFTFEIVVVDDGSTDSTAVVVRRAEAFSLMIVRYVWQSNAGVGTARNKCVKEANGVWIAFFDDDQIAPPEWLLSLYQEVLRSGAECVAGPITLLIDKSSKIKPIGTVRKLLGENPFVSRPSSFLSQVHPSRKTSTIPGTGNVLVKKSVFQRLGGFREGLRYGEDFEFFQRLARCGTEIALAPNAVVQHVIPTSRLSLNYLLPLAKRAARFQADCIRKYHGRTRLLYTIALRSIHLVGWIIPGLLMGYLFKRRDILLAMRCSLHFTLHYVSRAVDHLSSNVTDVFY